MEGMSAPAAHRKFFNIPAKAPECEDVMKSPEHPEPDSDSAIRMIATTTGDSDGDCNGTIGIGIVTDSFKISLEKMGVPDSSIIDTDDENKASVSKNELFISIRENVIGNNKFFSGPYGLRNVEYCDYTASGRSLQFIEDYITQEVLPDYGNTHTTTTVTSLQTTLFRNEARDIIRNAVNASEHDAVIFAGSGCTAAIHKLIHALHFTEPPVAFVGPYEHHSNLLPWREAGAGVCRVRETSDGLVDLRNLEKQLKEWSGRGRQLIGCFSAASNITGVLCDVNAITILLHQHDALALWDYATAGAYVNLDMNPVVNNSADQALVYKDAIFLSPHKFVGGVQTPGILVAKKNLFKNPVPSDCGGGSVFFVRRLAHRYLQEAEMREESGTPAIVESIRAGLVFQLKEAIGSQAIMEREDYITRYAMETWSSCPNLVLLGSTSVPRLAIFSFLVRHHTTGRFLHYNFVAAILNDLFGIQARGGCACAGPYAQDLLGINEELAAKFEEMLVEDSRLDRVHLRRHREYSDKEILRPGFVRLNIPFFASDDVIHFVVEAVKIVAEHAWKLLPQYTFNPETGEWRHRSHQVFRDRKWLGFISYKSGSMTYRDPPCPEKGPLPKSRQECLDMALKVLNDALKVRVHIADQTLLFDDQTSELRWFLLPSEALSLIQNPTRTSPTTNTCFEPVRYPKGVDSDSHAETTLNQNQITSTDSEKFTKYTHREESSKPLDREPRASRRKRVARAPRGPRPVQCFSEERSVSSITATLVADGFFAALKNIGKDVGSNNFSGDFQTRLVTATEDDKTTDAVHTAEASLNCDIPQTKEQIINKDDRMSADCEFLDEPLNDGTSIDHKISEELKGKQIIADQNTTNSLSIVTEDEAIPQSDGQACLDGSIVTEDEAIPQSDGQACLDGSIVTKDEAIPQPDRQACLDGSIVTKDEAIPQPDGQACLDGSIVTKDEAIPQPDGQACLDGSIVTKDEAIPQPDGQACLDGSIVTKDEAIPQPDGQACLDGSCFVKREKSIYTDSLTDETPAGEHRHKWHSPNRKIFNPTIEALEEFNMIHDGDRVLVCLSGGKDSLSLLHTLHQYQFYAKKKGISFTLGAVTIDPLTSSYDPSPLKGYLKELDLPYFYEEQGILEAAEKLGVELASICSFCSRMKRGRIYFAARRETYNVLAMGQHLDDLAESFLMSVFHNGLLRTMKACYTVQEGDLRVIRPFVYVREKDLRDFAELKKLPIIPENCPACFEAPKERHRMKQLLAAQEVIFPRLFYSIKSAIKPIISINKTGVNVRKLFAQLQGDDQDEM